MRAPFARRQVLSDLARKGRLHPRRVIRPRAQGEKLVVARHEQADPMSERAHLRELVGNGARSLDADGISVVERARVFNDDTRSLEKFTGNLARLRLRLGGL